MECDTCKKSFEWLREFSVYGHDNPLKKQEAANKCSYCEDCFAKKDAELDKNMVNKDINTDKEELNV